MMQLKNILVPTDFSPFSSVALRYGCELAKRFKAELHVLNVVWCPLHDYVEKSDGGHTKSFDEYEQDLRDAADRQIRDLCVDPVTDADSVTYATRAGSPFASIIQYARAVGNDLIVMGTHGRTGLKHVLIGSVAENVVRKAPCPVLTVRHPEHEFVVP